MAVGVVAPYTELITKPIAGSVAVVELADILKSGLPVLPEGTYTSQPCLSIEIIPALCALNKMYRKSALRQYLTPSPHLDIASFITFILPHRRICPFRCENDRH